MPFFAAPNVVHAPDDVLELARSIVDADSLDVERDDGIDISCKAGCSACCTQAVPVTAAELRSIADYIAGQPTTRQRELTMRVERTVAELGTAGFTSKNVPIRGAAKRDDYSLDYFKQQVPCPLLDPDGTCGVRPVRPLACRDYLVSSDPIHCESLDVEHVMRLGSERDVVAGFVRVSAHFSEPEIHLLALSLSQFLGSSPAVATTNPVRGATIVHMLTDERRVVPERQTNSEVRVDLNVGEPQDVTT